MTTHKRFTDDSFKKEPWFRAVCASLLSCNTEDEMANFLRDIGTLSELQAWSERLEVAKQLARGLSYREVAKNTGASTTTVTRVAKFIENGLGGYRKVLKAHRHHRLMKGQISMHASAEGRQNQADTPTMPVSAAQPISLLQKYLDKK
jgi:TrpR-related protein YerC/YecD